MRCDTSPTGWARGGGWRFAPFADPQNGKAESGSHTMLRRFLKDSAIYGVSSLLARGIGLLLLPLYTRALSPTDYGRVDLLLVVRSVVAVTLSLEIGQALVRFLVEAKDDAGRRELVS